MSSKPRTLAAWLAILAMALQALWPLVAQAKPRSVTLVPVCTVGGVTHYIELKGTESPVEKGAASHHEHCAFCSFDGGRATVQPSTTTLLPAASGNEIALEGRVVSASPAQRHPPAHPRAPPAAS
jgi:hypothetical protein